jgi:hypothetical protein
MKNLEGVKLKAEFVNEYGERMTMVVDSDNKTWVHHTDCNEDFELLEKFGTTYILTTSEMRILNSFVGMKESLKERTIEDLLNPKVDELLIPQV